VPKTGKILSLSYRNIAAILTGAMALLSFSALVWISEASEPAPEPPAQRSLDPPVLPVTELPSSGLDGLGALPPRR
jgi:hypothetical protein